MDVGIALGLGAAAWLAVASVAAVVLGRIVRAAEVADRGVVRADAVGIPSLALHAGHEPYSG